MILRVNSIDDFLGIDKSIKTVEGYPLPHEEECEIYKNRIKEEDFDLLGKILMHFNPSRVFEVGTYLGMSTRFILETLPGCTVTTASEITGKYAKMRGHYITPILRKRCEQIIFDNKISNLNELIEKFNGFDAVFISDIGDHSRHRIKFYTELAMGIVGNNGIVIWANINNFTSANTRPYLNGEDSIKCIAPTDMEQSGRVMVEMDALGMACWSEDIQKRIDEMHKI